jgi:hypothetical protein
MVTDIRGISLTNLIQTIPVVTTDDGPATVKIRSPTNATVGIAALPSFVTGRWSMVTDMPHTSLTPLIETIPVVTSDRRWPCNREDKGPEHYFAMFPECRDDPFRNNFGQVTSLPSSTARGGGLFPVLLLLNNGRLCCSTRTGSAHSADASSEISLSFSDDRGRTWSDYQIAVKSRPEDNLDYRNQSLGQSSDGHLVLTYGTIGGREDTDTGGSNRNMESIRSADGGQTWSEPIPIELPTDTWLNPHGQMRRLSNGTLAFNARGGYLPDVLRHNPNLPGRVSYMYRSTDDGQSWRTEDGIGYDASETGFDLLDDGRWIGYVRYNDRPNQIARSNDGGLSWDRWEESTAAGYVTSDRTYEHAGSWRLVNGQLNKPSPGSVTVLPNGKVLVTYGHRAYPFGVRAIVSHDGGDTFDVDNEFILSDTAYCWDCGYPSTVCFDNGEIVTTSYTVMDIEHPEWGTCCMAYRYHQDDLGRALST